MWRKPEETKPAAPAANVPTPTPAPATPAPVQAAAPRVEPSVRTVAGLTAEVVQPSGGIITSTILIKGEVRGSDDLYIDGEVRGTIELTNGRVTIGPHGKITADVDAREIVVRGKVSGSLLGRDRVEIGSTGEVNGDISTLRISIGEGAQIHSRVEIDRPDSAKSKKNDTRPATKTSANVPAMAQAVAVKVGAENGN
jgi:cytoskeletal protein CcmA (bactofilin family)